MDSFELNKILGAVLFTCLVTLALNITAGAIFTPEKPAKPGYEIVVPEQADQAGPQQAGPATDEPLETLLASAAIDRGEQQSKKCTTCHTFGKGEPNKVGPNLWGIVERNVASAPGFAYSPAMKGKGGAWTIEELNKYLANPNALVPNTTMKVPGVPRGKDRADLIAFLNAKADNPKPLPVAKAQ